MKKITVKNLEENLIGKTKCGDNISKLNDVEYIWSYRETDNLGRMTKVYEKENADCIMLEPIENVLKSVRVLELK